MTDEESAHIYTNDLERSADALLVSVSVRNGFHDRTIHRIAHMNNYMEIIDALIKQLEYQFNKEFTQVNVKVRKLSPKERLVFELAT